MRRLIGLFLVVCIHYSYAQDDIKVLFVGNSLVYANDLPRLLELEAKKRNVNLTAEMIAYPNYALEDHWNDGDIKPLIKRKKFDYVVVQQGPSSQTLGRLSLLEFGEKFQTLCQEGDAKLAFFMVWPSLTYYSTFDGVIANYQDAAQQNNAILCPVGAEWKQHFDKTKDFSFYGYDGFHPSPAGSQRAAEIILASLIAAQ